MERVLVFDTETTGTDPNRDHVVEVGAVLWSVRHSTTIACYSTLLAGDSNAAEHINRIPSQALEEGCTPESAWERLYRWVFMADAILAHNAPFDRSFCPEGWDQNKPWIDTQRDIAWPMSSESRSLVAVALAHGLGVSHAHRALTDTQIIVRLLERCVELGHNVEAMLVNATRPKSKYIALVSYDMRHLAKEAGFSWDGDRKCWWREMADADAENLGFKVRRVQ